MVPVMVGGIVLSGKTYTMIEYAQACSTLGSLERLQALGDSDARNAGSA